MAPVKKILLV